MRNGLPAAPAAASAPRGGRRPRRRPRTRPGSPAARTAATARASPPRRAAEHQHPAVQQQVVQRRVAVLGRDRAGCRPGRATRSRPRSPRRSSSRHPACRRAAPATRPSGPRARARAAGRRRVGSSPGSVARSRAPPGRNLTARNCDPGEPMNARWVAERRIERVAARATLHTELGSWPLRRGVVPPEVPVREVLKGRLRVDEEPVQIAGVLDDLYADAVHARLGPVWEDGVPSLAVWAPTARDVALRLGDPRSDPGRGERIGMERGGDGVWRVTGDPSWRDAEYAFEVTVFAPAVTAWSRTSSPTRTRSRSRSTRTAPCSRSCRRPATGPSRRRSASATPRSTSCTSATSRSATRRSRRRTAAPTSRSRTRTAPACGTCAHWPKPG